MAAMTSYTATAVLLLAGLLFFASFTQYHSIGASDRTLRQFPVAVVRNNERTVSSISIQENSGSLPVHSSELRQTIVLFGDSVPENFGSLLAKEYNQRADILLPSVITSSLPTYTSEENNKENDPQNPVLFVTVMFGTNGMDNQQVTIKDYGQYLISSVEHIQATMGTDVPIVIIAPPPVAPSRISTNLRLPESSSGAVSPAQGNSNMRARAYGFKARQVAQQCNLAYVDTWALFEGMTDESDFGPRYMALDGVHPNEYGEQVIVEGIQYALKNRYPEVLPMSDAEGRIGTQDIQIE